MSRYNQTLVTVFILILNIPAAMTIDEHAPSLPAMMGFFHTNAATMQLTITFYMLGMALSQWICGILSDRFGRRPVLIVTGFIFLLATLLCLFSTHFSVLLMGRFFQGAGSGLFAMISPALIGEALDKERIPKVSAYFSMSYALIPILAPVIGGYIQDLSGWEGNFVFMFIVAFIIYLFAIFCLPETHVPTEQHRLHIPSITKSYIRVFTNREYMGAVIGMIFVWSSIIAFSILGPFLLQNTLKLSAIQYGHYALLIGLGFLIGNSLHTRLIKKIDSIKTGQTLAIFISLFQLILVWMGWVNLATLMLPTFLYMAAVGLIFPALYGKAATVFTDIVGIASSLIGCLILIGAVVITALMTSFKAHEPITLPLIYLSLISLSTIATWIGFKKVH